MSKINQAYDSVQYMKPLQSMLDTVTSSVSALHYANKCATTSMLMVLLRSAKEIFYLCAESKGITVPDDPSHNVSTRSITPKEQQRYAALIKSTLVTLEAALLQKNGDDDGNSVYIHVLCQTIQTMLAITRGYISMLYIPPHRTVVIDEPVIPSVRPTHTETYNSVDFETPKDRTKAVRKAKRKSDWDYVFGCADDDNDAVDATDVEVDADALVDVPRKKQAITTVNTSKRPIARKIDFDREEDIKTSLPRIPLLQLDMTSQPIRKYTRAERIENNTQEQVRRTQVQNGLRTEEDDIEETE